MIKVLFLVVLVISGIFSGGVSADPQTVGPANVVFIENGWDGEGFAVHLDKGISGCPSDPTFFALSSAHKGYKELVSILMAAYYTESKVQLIVDQGVCLMGNRTKILSIRQYRFY